MRMSLRGRTFSLRGRRRAKPVGYLQAQLAGGPLEAMVRPRFGAMLIFCGFHSWVRRGYALLRTERISHVHNCHVIGVRESE
jgi:hypothetical protein